MKKDLGEILKNIQIRENDKDLIEVLINICKYYKITDAKEIINIIKKSRVIKKKEDETYL